MKTILYPGSFDPVTRGHLDIIKRANDLCDRLVVAVMINPDKRGTVNFDQRVKLLEEACRGIPHVEIVMHKGLVVECAAQYHADAIVRGVRPLGDFDNEMMMAQVNRMLGGVETIFLPTSDDVANISSSMVRQIASFGGNIEKLVPEGMEEQVLAALKG